jgi:hypothetical protein
MVAVVEEAALRGWKVPQGVWIARGALKVMGVWALYLEACGRRMPRLLGVLSELECLARSWFFCCLDSGAEEKGVEEQIRRRGERPAGSILHGYQSIECSRRRTGVLGNIGLLAFPCYAIEKTVCAELAAMMVDEETVDYRSWDRCRMLHRGLT